MTAQPSPDLPDSPQHQTKPAGEDVYAEVTRAQHIDSGNRVAHLCGCDNDPIECDHEAARGQAEEGIRRLTADLAAMTARAAELTATLTRALGAFYERGHPGYPAVRTGWVSETNLAEWQRVAVGETAPLSAPSATVSAPEPSTVVREGSEGLGGSEDGSGGAA